MIDPKIVVNDDKSQDNFVTATIAAVEETGFKLIFPGQTAASEKTYKGNSAVRFYTGQRVRVLPDSGTYIVEYPIAGPNLYRTVSFSYIKESSGTVTWGDDDIKVSYTQTNYSGVDVRTTEPIDLTNVQKIEFLIRINTFTDSRGLYIGVAKNKLEAAAQPPWAQYFAAGTLLTSAGVWHRFVDVSNLTGEYYVCCHAYAQTYTIKSINLI